MGIKKSKKKFIQIIELITRRIVKSLAIATMNAGVNKKNIGKKVLENVEG